MAGEMLIAATGGTLMAASIITIIYLARAMMDRSEQPLSHGFAPVMSPEPMAANAQPPPIPSHATIKRVE
jgi:hypothetical protein